MGYDVDIEDGVRVHFGCCVERSSISKVRVDSANLKAIDLSILISHAYGVLYTIVLFTLPPTPTENPRGLPAKAIGKKATRIHI
jgi:hypothetical protein